MAGKEAGAPRGKLTPYAFFLQVCREEHKRKYPTEKVEFSEFNKKCTERWKTMSDVEKKRFNMLSEMDKKRYDHEMKSFRSQGEGSKGKKTKKVKDPNAPKRPQSSYFFFVNSIREEIKAEQPGISVGDVAKEAGRRWAELDASDKEVFEAQAEEAKIRYQKEKAAYDAGQGGGGDSD